MLEGERPFQLSCSHIEMFNQYYRSIVMIANRNSRLETLYQKVRMYFEPERDDIFMPHVSLLYSDLDLKRKKELFESISIRYPLSVTISAALLVETNGGPDQWKEILRIPFCK